MKRLLPLLFAVGILTGGCAFGWYWMSTGRFIEETDNAYVRCDITQVSARVAGYVKEVLVEDNRPVAAGDPLVRVEDLEFRLRLERGRGRLEEREAALEVARNRSRLQGYRIEGGRARVAAAEAEQGKTAGELRRFGALFSDGILSEQEYETVATDEKKSRAEAAEALAGLRTAEREREVLLAEERRLEAEVRQQEEELKLLEKELRDTVVCAPVAGVVGNRRVRTGQYVRPGTVLLSVIPRDVLWVEANFKEVQLARMREGQPVSVEVDAFPGRRLAGRVESLSPASGAEFSLIPPENATGNFTKIVQRVPVRIRFEAGEPLLRDLRAGMSAVVRLDTRGRE